MTTVDVVVPTFERPRLLQRAVRSVLCQTHQDFRLWVADSGSAPPARLEPELAADPRVQTLRLEPPSPAGKARNAGLARGRAAYVAFLDDDDEWHPEKLARQLDMFERLPAEVGLVGCAYFFDLRGRRRLVVPRPGTDVRRTLLARPVFAASSTMVRRAAFEAVGGFDTTLTGTDDWELWLRLTDAYEVRVLAEPLAFRRESHKPPETMIAAIERLRRLTAPRLAALPPRERRRVQALHSFDEAIWHARAGRPREARRLLLRAWRSDPRRLWALGQMGRTIVGERAWEAAARRRPTRQARVRGFPA